MQAPRPFLIGIAGGSGSGKTYLAACVAEAVGNELVSVLSMDQYFRTSAEGANGADINFDHPGHLDLDLLRQHLLSLKAGETVQAPLYDFKLKKRLDDVKQIEPQPIVIVEGLFVLAEPIVSLFDVTCFLEVDADQRLLGRILRDTRERGSTVAEIADRYQRFVRPSYQVFVSPTKQNADVVVDFTYRRILFAKLLKLLLSSYIDNPFDLKEFARTMRAECDHLGFTPREGLMPVTIDITKLAEAFPESTSIGETIR